MASVEVKRGRRVGPRFVASIVAIAAVAAASWSFLSLKAGPLNRGRAAYERGDWPEAAREARFRLKDAPDDLEALRLLARVSLHQGRDESAKAIYSRIGPGSMQAEDYFLMGENQVRRKDLGNAKMMLEEAKKASPNDPRILWELTRVQDQLDEPIAATATAEQLARIPGWETKADVVLAAYREKLSDPAAASAAMGRALRRDPTLADTPTTPAAARKLLARALLRTGRPAEAREPLRAVLALGPDREASWLMSRVDLQEGKTDAAKAGLALSKGSDDDEFNGPEPAPYVGSARCGECHASIHRSQQGSLHARTYFPPHELKNIPLPEKPVPDPGDPRTVHSIQRDGDGIRVETSTESGEIRRALVEFAVGSGDRGLTLVGRDEGGLSRELRISRYNDGSGWGRTTGHQVHLKDHEELSGKPLSADAVRVCLGCHVTDARSAQEKLPPLVADRGIGCERCHGPGGNHVKAVEARFTGVDMAIARPQLYSADRVIKLCGQCHSPRGGKELADPAHKFSVKFQGATLVRSKCYTESKGAIQCLTCHNPHRNAETSPAYYESKCLSCHSPEKEKPPTATSPEATDDFRRVPCPVNPTTGCVSCHMPSVKDAIPHSKFADHYIRVHPRVQADASR